MTKKIAAVACMLAMFYAFPVFSYQREVRPSQNEQEETRPSPVLEEKGSGHGLMITGYTLIGLGSAAAIAGSAIATASNRRLTGVIVGSSGAALGLAGSFMLLFSAHQGYGFAPQIDPIKNQYGLAFAANF